MHGVGSGAFGEPSEAFVFCGRDPTGSNHVHVNSHETVTTKFAEADGVHYAYRRFGGPSDAPLVFCHRFRGTMDDWDPATINGFARERYVIILFDNAGVGLSTGLVPNSG
jgi:alpha-beta hydrolase superfamily lysophospholipase